MTVKSMGVHAFGKFCFSMMGRSQVYIFFLLQMKRVSILLHVNKSELYSRKAGFSHLVYKIYPFYLTPSQPS